VQTGTETGRIGLYLFLLVIWTSARTLLFAKTRDPEQERVRRILFVLLLTYCVSGWMVDFAYRASFFMFTAAIAVFHRMLYLPKDASAEDEDDAAQPVPPWRAAPLEGALVPAGAAPLTVAATATSTVTTPAIKMPWQRRSQAHSADEAPTPKPIWNRIGLVDLAVTAGLLIGTEQFWSFAIRTF
jgi:hypothetical protein